eukprot:263214-Hanusia_phi.AAC.6
MAGGKQMDLFAKILNDDGQPKKVGYSPLNGLFGVLFGLQYIRSEEQMKIDAEIAKNYTRMRYKEHIELQKRMTLKIKWRDAATEALPEELQEEARALDLEPFPSNRRVYTDYPPAPEHLRL